VRVIASCKGQPQVSGLDLALLTFRVEVLGHGDPRAG
jgi:hypothetical protein